MTKRIFISYSHKDESFRDCFNDHLAVLQRNGVISIWHDRKILAGDEWKGEISENLNSADIAIFLVSPSFLASDYCYDVEVKRAIELNKAGSLKIISVVIRPCQWDECEFSKYQAVPKDAKAVSTWPNQDEAWLDVANRIRQQILDFSPAVQKTTDLASTASLALTETLTEWYEDIDVILTHRKVNQIKLSHIYVPLDLEVSDNESDEIKIINSSNKFSTSGKSIIFGEEQQGKTSLLKYIHKQLLSNKVLTLYIDGKEINQSDLKSTISKAIKWQYTNLTPEQFLAMSDKALLIDNIDQIGLNQKYREALIKSINDAFSHVVITSNSSFMYITPEITGLNEYDNYDLLGLGHQKRAEIIEKWVVLGIEESIQDEELFIQCDEIKSRLDAIIRKNIVPAKPIYILMLLQMFEAYSQQNLELSSYGHCYQQLVYQAFDHAGIPKKEVDKYINVLTEFAWALHTNGGGLNQNSIDLFFSDYEKTYLPVDGRKIIEILKKNSILAEQGVKTNFKYQYFYYFFTAKKIAESYHTSNATKEEVGNLIKNLHREDCANILVFVTHHTKDAWVLNEIQTALDHLFSEQPLATLSRDELSFMDDFISQIPELVIEQREIRDERAKVNSKLDKNESLEPNEELEPIDILANINRAFKGMEIAGQIIRSRHATLTRSALHDLASNGIFTGLRFLEYFIKLSDIAKSEVIKFIAIKIGENPSLSDVEVQDYAKDIFLHMTFGIINGIVKKIASSIGSNEATEIYSNILTNTKSPALILVNQAIELQFTRRLNTSSLNTTKSQLENNPVCTRILTEMVIQHTYMFPVSYKDKQKLAELLNISVKGQRILDLQKDGKG